jgi:hypothetical protein
MPTTPFMAAGRFGNEAIIISGELLAQLAADATYRADAAEERPGASVDFDCDED